MSLIKIITYKTNTGKEPFALWLFDLDKNTRATVSARLDRISLGNFGDCKSLKNTSGIYELRIDCGPGYRIYFGRQGATIIILLTGGDKSSQNRDITKAQKYWLIYKESQK